MVALLALYPCQEEDMPEDEDSPRRDEAASVGFVPVAA